MRGPQVAGADSLDVRAGSVLGADTCVHVAMARALELASQLACHVQKRLHRLATACLSVVQWVTRVMQTAGCPR